MKKILTILALAALTVPAKAQLQEFSLPGQEYRPHVRMWIPVAANDEGDLRDQIKDLAKAGFGDVEIVAFDAERSGGRGPQAAQHPPRIPVDKYGWGTAAWTNTMKTVLDECGKNGMKATFTLGPAWPVASPLLEKDSPGVEIQLACTRYDLEGGSFTGEYPEDAFAVVAGRRKSGSTDLDPSTLKVVTADAVRGNTISWTAPAADGEWSILVYRNEKVGEMKSGFYVVDHLSLDGTRSVIDYYTPVFRELEKEGLLKYLSGLFGDSLEYRASVDWTPSFPEVFKRLKGYDITPYLPAIHNGVSTGGGGIFGGGFGKDSLEGTGESILNDYYSVVTYLFNENHLKPLQAFLEQYGGTLRYQTAYGKYMEQASTSMNVGIPEGEMMMIRNSFDNIRAQAGAVHVAGRKEFNAELQAESGKNHAQSWQNLLFFIQRTFASGVNNFTMHGYNYNGRFSGEGNVDGFVPSVEWPGWEGFGQSGFSNSWGAEPLWEMAPIYTGFIARNGYILKQGNPAIDLAVFRESYWDNASFTENQDGQVWYRDGALLQDKGWSFDFVGLPQFNHPGTSVRNGRLYPDGPAYKALVIDQSLNTRNEPVNGKKTISLESARKILSFAKAGLPVVVIGEAPSKPSHYGEHEKGTVEIPVIMAELLSLSNVKTAASFEAVPAALESLGLQPDAFYSQRDEDPKFINIHRKADGVDYFYIYNRGTNANSGNQYGWGYGQEKELPYGQAQVNVTFNCEGTPYRLDAWSGKAEKILNAVRTGGKIIIPVSLEGNESTIIAFDRTGSFSGSENEVSRTMQGSPIRISQWTLDVESWNPGKDAASVDKKNIHVGLTGLKPWNAIAELGQVSGIGTYTATVKVAKGWKQGYGAILDLGTVNYSYRVYVNGKEVTASQTNSKIDVGQYLKKGNNEIRVRVATTLNNRLKEMSGNSRRTDDPYGLIGNEGAVTLSLYKR